jgi:hypothetical protein
MDAKTLINYAVDKHPAEVVEFAKHVYEDDAVLSEQENPSKRAFWMRIIPADIKNKHLGCTDCPFTKDELQKHAVDWIRRKTADEFVNVTGADEVDYSKEFDRFLRKKLVVPSKNEIIQTVAEAVNHAVQDTSNGDAKSTKIEVIIKNDSDDPAESEADEIESEIEDHDAHSEPSESDKEHEEEEAKTAAIDTTAVNPIFHETFFNPTKSKSVMIDDTVFRPHPSSTRYNEQRRIAHEAQAHSTKSKVSDAQDAEWREISKRFAQDLRVAASLTRNDNEVIRPSNFHRYLQRPLENLRKAYKFG